MIAERYLKNINSFSEEELNEAQQKKICIVGCGGLGGHVASTLARFGVGEITLVDGDTFSESNLNRQAFCTEKTLGREKAIVAKEVIGEINRTTKINVFVDRLDVFNGASIIKNHHCVIDCLDNITSRIILQELCKKEGIPLVHGAIAGFFGQVSVIFPGDDTLLKIYNSADKGIENIWGNPSFIPLIVAAIQCSEALKTILKHGEVLRHKLLLIDVLHNDFEIIELQH